MRITLDWDSISYREFQKRMRLIRFMFKNYRIEAERSAGGHGYHVIVYGLPDDIEWQIRLRELLKDDPVRVHMDKLRLNDNVCRDVLYTEKKGNKVIPVEFM